MIKLVTVWIVRTYGNKTEEKYYDKTNLTYYNGYNIKITQNEFENKIHLYLQQYIDCNAKHTDSNLLIND